MENKKFINEAKKAAQIVTVGVESHNYLDMSKQLEILSNDSDKKDEYVFERPGLQRHIIMLVLCLLFIPIFIKIIFLGFGTLIYSDEMKTLALLFIFAPIVFICINLLIIIGLIKNICFYKRYDKYFTNLKYHSIEIIYDLSTYSKVEEKAILKDLNTAVKYSLIPQGHFGCDNIIFITSDNMYDKYKEKQAAYDIYYKKQLEDRKRLSERTEEIQKILDIGQEYISKIHDSNVIIKDKIITRKLYKMESVVKMIFNEVDINPDQADKLGMFLNYYLPTTEKILESYIDLDEKYVKGKALKSAQKEIGSSLDTINEAFQNILNKFYEEKEVNVVTTISSMEIMMKNEGLAK